MAMAGLTRRTTAQVRSGVQISAFRLGRRHFLRGGDFFFITVIFFFILGIPNLQK